MPSDQVEVLQAQLARSAAEIERRSGAQQALHAGHLTVMSAVLGVVLANKTPAIVLLVLPVLSLGLGMAWLDHHMQIRRIATFIAETEKEFCAAASTAPTVTLWEGWRLATPPAIKQIEAWTASVWLAFPVLGLVAAWVAINAAFGLEHPVLGVPIWTLQAFGFVELVALLALFVELGRELWRTRWRSAPPT